MLYDSKLEVVELYKKDGTPYKSLRIYLDKDGELHKIIDLYMKEPLIQIIEYFTKQEVFPRKNSFDETKF